MTIKSLGAAAALLSLSLALTACAAPTDDAPEDAANVNAGAERSYDDAELDAHDGSSYFPDEFTYDELMEDHSCQPGQAVGGAFTAGAYLVGAQGSPTPGTYHLDGTDDAAGDLIVYAPSGEEGLYRSKFAINYLGFTLVDLDEGDVVFFKPAQGSDLMGPEPSTPLDVSEPYESGLYRVGVDIPAGTYGVTQSQASADAIAAKAYARPQVIVYATLDFGTDNEVSEEELPRLEDGPASVEVTVEDGQFLELYGTTAIRREA